MKKHIIALAVAAAVAAPAAAMADTTLYGKIHASYDFWGGDNAADHNHSLASNSSRIGVKGSEKLNDSLSVVYQWESEVNWGSANGNAGGLAGARNTFIGLTGGWGTAIAGRHDTPMKMVGRKYDLFGDTVGDSRAIIRGKAVGSDFDLRTNNTVAYITPNLAGFHAVLAYVSDWNNDVNNKENAYSLSAGYSIAGFMIDGAYEKHNQVSGTTADDAYRIGAGYKIAGFKIVGMYQKIKNAGNVSGSDVNSYGVGGAYSFGANTVKAQYYKAGNNNSVSNTGADLWAVGYDYKLSKQTKVYAAYAQVKNDSATNSYILAKSTGHDSGDVSAVYPSMIAGGKSSAFSVGIEHKF